MIFPEAVLMGIQRYANIVPDVVSRMSTNHDITVNGFTIPANTHVMPLFVELLKVKKFIYQARESSLVPEGFLMAQILQKL